MRAVPVEAAHPAQTVRTCQNIQLHVQPQTSQGAAGTIAIIYRLHNLFGGACTLDGYPGIQLLDRNFLSLPTRTHRGGRGPVVPQRTVRLPGHGNAYFALFYSDVPTAGQPPCATARYVMVIAPNTFLPVVTYATTRGGSIHECSGNVWVTPVTARPTY
jgi:hypothetical protein